MSSSNNNIQLANLDFQDLKNSLISYLQSPTSPFKDYNFNGSTLSYLLDPLVYNTQYNAYYLNMIANEMFLDSAIQRKSVISRAKELGYTPKSSIAPTAKVNLVVNGVSGASLTLPAYSNFLSEAIDGVNYNFVNTDSHTVSIISNVATFTDVEIKQGIPSTKTFTYDSNTNAKSLFHLDDSNIDTTTLSVKVYPNPSNNYFDVFNLSTDFLMLNSSSQVYFLDEALEGGYNVYFGDGVIGQQLIQGCKVTISYVSTRGTSGAGANNFVLTSNISSGTPVVQSITPASNGGAVESIESIKFQAPKAYSAQGRAVSKEDYITAIQQNKLGYSFDAVNVWGGEENNPPVYGQVFISVKPTGSYTLTQTQKTRLIQDVIKPISVMTVQPTMIDPDYTYIQITANVLYDSKKTTNTSSQIQDAVKTAILSFANSSLNTFNSTFSSSDLVNAISSADPSIITNDFSIQLQKKFYPNITTPQTYNLYYNTELTKGMFLSGISSSPAVQFRNPLNLAEIIDGIYIEEVPSSTGGVDSISIINPGFSYTSAPTVTIKGDGTGATAIATIDANGRLKAITVTNAGSGYTSAIAFINNASTDTTGSNGVAVVMLQGRYGTLRSYYNNTENVKTVFNNNIGTIDYQSGIVTLNSFGPIQVDNDLGQLTVSTNPKSNIISSSYNRIITVDEFDPNAIVVNVTAKT